MKRFLALLATGVLAIGLSTSAHAQTRGLGAGALLLDDLQSPPHHVSLTAPMFGSAAWLNWQSAGFPNLEWSVPVPPANNAQAGFVYSGPLSGAVIPHIAYWVPPGVSGFNNNGGYAGAWDYATGAQLGLVAGSGTANQLTKWNGAGTSLVDAGFSDNGSIINTTEFVDLGNATTQGVLRLYESTGTLYTIAPSLGAMEVNNNFRILGAETATGSITARNGGAGQTVIGTNSTNEISANDGTLNTPSNINVNAGKLYVDATTGHIGVGITVPGNLLTNSLLNPADQGGDGLNPNSLNWHIPNTGGGGGGYVAGIMNDDIGSVNPHGLLVRTAATLPNTRVFTANAGGSDIVNVYGDGNVHLGINTATATSILSQIVSAPNIGTTASGANVLVLNAGNIMKTSATFPTGSGTLNTIAKWTPSGTQLGNSALTDDGTTLSYSGANVNTATAYQIGGGTVLRTPGTDNTFVGKNAGTTGAGGGNTAIGTWAGATLNGSASANIAIGEYALMSNSSGTDNTVVGEFAMQSNTTGWGNTVVGKSAMYGFGSASENTAVGWNALAVNQGSDNVAVGLQALTSNSSGTDNTGLGFLSGFTNSTGAGNIYLGTWSGFQNQTGSNNTIIGSHADVSSDGFANSTALGYQAMVTASNMMQLGNSSVTNVNTSGRYTTTAGVTLSGGTAPLSANGSVGLAGDVLTSAGVGATPTWVSGSSSFIKNQFASSQTGNFWINGNGRFEGGDLQVLRASGTGNAGLELGPVSGSYWNIQSTGSADPNLPAGNFGIGNNTDGWYALSIAPGTGNVTMTNGSVTLGTGVNATKLVSGATAARTVTFPDASGTVALTSGLAAYLPLAGGTMTGVVVNSYGTVSAGATITVPAGATVVEITDDGGAAANSVTLPVGTNGQVLYIHNGDAQATSGGVAVPNGSTWTLVKTASGWQHAN
jgi:hypothetical protein